MRFRHLSSGCGVHRPILPHFASLAAFVQLRCELPALAVGIVGRIGVVNAIRRDEAFPQGSQIRENQQRGADEILQHGGTPAQRRAGAAETKMTENPFDVLGGCAVVTMTGDDDATGGIQDAGKDTAGRARLQ